MTKGFLEDERKEATLNVGNTKVDVRDVGDPRRVPGHIREEESQESQREYLSCSIAIVIAN